MRFKASHIQPKPWSSAPSVSAVSKSPTYGPHNLFQAARTTFTGFVELHRTNYAPSAHEAAIIAGRIHELKQLSQDLVGSSLALIAQQERLREQIALAQALLAPWRRFPPELWSEVFSYSPSEDWISCPVDRRHLPLAEVCHVWRELALRIPHLWSSIVVEVWDDYEEKPPLRLGLSKAVATCLRRARTHPLHIRVVDHTFGWRGSDQYFASDQGMRLWDQLCETTDRWETVELSDMPPVSYAALSFKSFPILRSLRFRLEEDPAPEGEDFARILRVFSNAPALSVLGPGDAWVSPAFQLPSTWRLTSLNFQYDYFSENFDGLPAFGAVLACSQTLPRCRINSPCPDTIARGQLVEFAALEELVLEEGGLLLLELLRAPNLCSLALCQDLQDLEELSTLDLLKMLLYNSSGCCSLQALKLSDASIRNIEVALGRLPQLTALVVTDTNNQPGSINTLDDFHDLVQMLRRNPAHPDSLSLLPKLKRLAIRFGRTKDACLEDLIEKTISSRAIPCTPDGEELACLNPVDTARDLHWFPR
ncbi:uncharacterized protein SCHCODRAFT_02616165 [Schizophyllum commune H4-8]|nr:uncharacterized protein SCHCODRAFT_02616165 [Schizophyllum commune H4-8]KAI5896912.1 hypothetical protein SCHCODRAFT_02616165 [Schizophyllum commune H4-8]